MLAGIKTGKKKRKNPTVTVTEVASETALPVALPAAARQPAGWPDSATVADHNNNNNTNVAEQLRHSLAAGIALSNKDAPTVAGAASAPFRSQLFRDLERRGKIKAASATASVEQGGDEHSTWVDADYSSIAATAATDKDESDMTVQELLWREKSSVSSLAEQEARNIVRRGQKRRATAVAADSDEEDERLMLHAVRGSDPSSKSSAAARGATVIHDRQYDRIASACGGWWWLESSRFRRHRLLALGNTVSLVMAPREHSLIPGKHFYLVPIAHAPSLTTCDETVWNELRRFQSSLRALSRADNQKILFYETVLPSKNVWQTRMEAIIVPDSVWQDAPLFYRSALTEQAEEWGTHQKLMKTDSTKDLRATIPKNFPYFYVEYGDGDGAGYVQMIESDSFPKDFGVDIIAGMMQLDPLRFRSNKSRSSSNNEEKERQVILHFLEKWKRFDWTVELDEE